MKKLLLLTNFLFIYICTNAQVCEWAYTVGLPPQTEPVSVKEDHNGFHYVASHTDSSSTRISTQLMYMDVSQQLIWYKDIIGDAGITDVEVNAVNHAIVVGYFKGSVIIDGTPLNAILQTGFIFEVDESGFIVWLVTFNPSGTDFSPGDLFIGADGMFYITSKLSGANGWCAFHKLDPAGNIILNEFNNNFDNRTFSHIVADSVGNVYLSGTCSVFANFDTIAAANFPYQNFLVKYDSSFTAQWFMAREYITFDDNNKLCTDGQNLYWAFVDVDGSADSVKVFKVTPGGQVLNQIVDPLGMAFFPGVDFSVDRFGRGVLLIAAFTRFYIYQYDAAFNMTWNDTIWNGLTSFPTYSNLICYDSSFYVAGKYMHDTLMIDNFQLINPNASLNYPSDFFVARWHTDPVVTNVHHAENSGDVYIYPNPASDRLNISVGNTDAHFEIYDIKGRLLQKAENLRNSIDVSNLENGIYFLQVIADGRTSTSRFSVLH